MSCAFGRMVAHARAFADVMQQSRQQQRGILLVIVMLRQPRHRCIRRDRTDWGRAPDARVNAAETDTAVGTSVATAQSRNDLDHMLVDGVPMRGRGARTVADTQPFGHPPPGDADVIQPLPHLRQVRPAGQQPNQQRTLLGVPVMVPHRATREIGQRHRIDRQPRFARGHRHAQRQRRIGRRIGTGREYNLPLMPRHPGGDDIERRRLTASARPRLEDLEERESRPVVDQRAPGARRGVQIGERHCAPQSGDHRH